MGRLGRMAGSGRFGRGELACENWLLSYLERDNHAFLDAELIYCDETRLQALKEEGRRPQTTSYFSAQMTDSGVPIRCFTYTPGRGTKLADKLLFAGIREGAVMMSDGYEPYNDIAQRQQAVRRRGPQCDVDGRTTSVSY